MSKEGYYSKESKEKTGQLVLQLENITVSKGEQEILSDINLKIRRGEHIALVGPNGVGKTTLLKTIIEGEKPDKGKVMIINKATYGYVPQAIENVFPLNENRSILDYFLNSRGLDIIQNKMKKIEETMYLEKEISRNMLNEYENLQINFELKGGYIIESKAKAIMGGLNLSPRIELNNKITELSGGEKTKIFIAQILLADVDLLLLDEPSNHLDQNSVLWLGNYLNSYKGAVLAISHKPEFLNLFTQKIIEISTQDHHLETFYGTYSDYKKSKIDKNQQQKRLQKKTDSEIKKLKETVNRLKAGSRAKMAKDREKKLERKFKEISLTKNRLKEVKIQFEVANVSTLDVLKVNNLIKKYGKTNLNYANLNLNLQRGEKVVIIGPIGSGKSTLLKMISGEIIPDSGEITLGNKVDIGYYSQEMENLNPKNTILEEIKSTSPAMTEGIIRSFLGSFLFTKNEVFKQISVLSHGERSRLALAKIALNKHNFLVLDEPSNHLDVNSKRLLAKALNEYKGTLLLVSHDEEFLREIGLNKIISLPQGKIKLL